ncbi:hypothetical protein KUTeg_021167 [Tegillarca granosa]|uniref:Gelsolin n=1 Tax=Tegillarca granosa TaxID=220873 RepID=A0ABQ9EAH9_TEGGR|nr:hypothetical protein KUTeg_021167 [Tegillarca granosa]
MFKTSFQENQAHQFTYKEEDNEQLQHDVHFWIGKYSSQVINDAKLCSLGCRLQHQTSTTA